ncbi:UNKNOWN [Stylonychia lemnae]|uniref:Polynucleotide 5'-hydroxyl-kinase NOL9 n=1 Tax=Stylonychia lemnae TaxID=5949 RepID=A0A077ZSD3_STYLE|nr:UNKNOWN [Stylonychia lemnae]|eukprot:CDW72444.1 UNKNOWN [Stylonychia lemnae]
MESKINRYQEERKRSRSRDSISSSASSRIEKGIKILHNEPSSEIKIIMLQNKQVNHRNDSFSKQSFEFQGALQVQVLHGTVKVLGATLKKDETIWHQIISDPRKNMLIGLSNESNTAAVEELKLQVKGVNEDILIADLPENTAIIAIKQYKEYDEEELKRTIESDGTLSIQNMNRDIGPKKCFFRANKSWTNNLEEIIQSLQNSQTDEVQKIMINGIANVGKSTFATCLINMIQTLCDLEVYVMDLDPGQPNYNLAGQISLSTITQLILTNNDFQDITPVKQYYLNTPQPNLNRNYFLACVQQLNQTFQDSQSVKKKILIVNTFGWVEGIGAGMQLDIAYIIKPTHLVTLMKPNQYKPVNEFRQFMPDRYNQPNLQYFDVNSDDYAGVMNVKGAVQRNKKIIKALTQNKQDAYLFKEIQDNGSQLPLTFNSKTMRHDDFSLGHQQFQRLSEQPFQIIAFNDIALGFIPEQLSYIENKVDALRIFNNQLVAGISIDNAQFKSLRSYDDVRVTEIKFTDHRLPPIEIAFFGLIRDIDYEGGIKLIPQNSIDLSKVKFNALCLCHDSIFRFPSTYLIQDQSDDIRLRVEQDNEKRRVFKGNNNQSQGNHQNKYQRRY